MSPIKKQRRTRLVHSDVADSRLSKVTKITDVVQASAAVDGDPVKDDLGFDIIEQYNTSKSLLTSKLAKTAVRGFYVLRDRRVTSFTAACSFYMQHFDTVHAVRYTSYGTLRNIILVHIKCI